MTVGYPLNKGTLDNRIGHLMVSTDEILADWDRLYDLITSDSGSEAVLTSLGYSSQDVALIRAIVFGFHNLSQVARGKSEQTPANDFFFYEKMVRGVE